MQIIPRFYKRPKHIRINHESQCLYHEGNALTPTGRNPLHTNMEDAIIAISGWQYAVWYPNITNHSRYYLDKALIQEDTAASTAYVKGLPHIPPIDNIWGSSIHLSIGNLVMEHNLYSNTCSMSLGNNQDIYTDPTPPTHYQDSFTFADMGENLTDPTSAGLSNHYMVKYTGLDRGYGRMKSGWFFADVAGSWSWSVDGNDVVEVAIDDKVVASKYSNSAPVGGAGILYGDITLSTGWHHFFAYTSDRSDSSHPLVWFKRPGDSSWNVLASDSSDGVKWSINIQQPSLLSFSSSGGNITATYGFSSTRNASLVFDAATWEDGELKIRHESIPRFYVYYQNNWRSSTQNDYVMMYSPPPIFDGMRVIAKYAPQFEKIISSRQVSKNGVDRVLVRRKGTTLWYYWDGSSFININPTSIADLDSGNTWYELNQLTDAEWITLPGSSNMVDVVEIMFTGEAPLFMTSQRRLMGNPSTAKFLMMNKHNIIGEIYAELRDI